MNKQLSNRTVIGYLAAIFSGIAYGLNPFFAIPLYDSGLTTESVLFYRFLHASLFLALLIVFQKKSFRLTKKQMPQMVLPGLMCALAAVSLFLSFHILPSGIAVTLVFTCPVWVVLIHIVCFRRKPSPLILTGLILAFAGVFLISGGGTEETISLAGLAAGLFSGLTYAVYMICIEQSPELKQLSSVVQTFYTMLICFLLFSLYFLIVPNMTDAVAPLQLPPDFASWLWILGLAFFPTFLAFWLIAAGIQRIGSAPTAIIGALEPMTAMGVGILFFHEKPTLLMFFGAAVILISVLIVIRPDGKNAEK